MITRRSDDNDVINDFRNPKADGGKAQPPPDPLPTAKNVALGAIHFQMVKERPAANITTEAGAPLLSWRVAILPYIDQKELSQNIRRNEAWNSEHNKEFHGRMPGLYRTRGASERFRGWSRMS
jgi:hypothetical protein